MILCALYESLFVPIAVILSVPFGLAGSFLFAKMFGLENNIYLQIGLLMLIGLLAKTAILLTEYASERRRQGMSISQAAVSAAQVRLRPILMTSLTMIFGMLPLMFASGVGANGNISIGVGTVGGMLIGTVALLLSYRYCSSCSNIYRNVLCLNVNCRNWKKKINNPNIVSLSI